MLEIAPEILAFKVAKTTFQSFQALALYRYTLEAINFSVQLWALLRGNLRKVVLGLLASIAALRAWAT